MKVPALLAVGAGLLLCGSATASVLPYQAQSQQIAAAQFPEVTCPVTVDLEGMPAEKLALADVSNCAIHFNPLAGDQPVYVTCAAMVHEYGHLAGLGHSTDPSNVMYPVPTPKSTPLPCFDIDPAVERYNFTAPAHKRVRFDLRRHRSRTLDLLRAYVRGRRAREVVSISRFAGEGVHVSVSAKNGRITIKALNRGSRRARVQVYVGPGVEVPTNVADR